MGEEETDVAPVRPPSYGEFLTRPPGLAAAIGALLFWWFSLTPSMLPRSWLAQGAVSALAALSGYLVGAASGWLLRLLRPDGEAPTPGWQRAAWPTFGFVAGVATGVGVTLWIGWQNDHRTLVGLQPLDPIDLVSMLVATLVLFAILAILARTIAWIAIRIAAGTSQFVSTRAAVGITLVVLLSVGVVLINGAGEAFVNWARNQAGAIDRSTEDGVTMPSSPLVSGSPDSLAPWDTLGFQGRTFVASAPTIAELRAFGGEAADMQRPIRLYAGLRSAPTAEERAQLIVDELERTAGFERQALVVVTVTGTGWVDPDAARAIEYMYGGDTAMVAMQYSYLPSWISFLVDGEVATEAATALNAALTDALAAIPEEQRPDVLLFAQSLGSLGSEQAVVQEDVAASLDVLTTVPKGALYSGPTFGNPIWRQVVEAREPPSAVWQPLVDQGTTVRVENEPLTLDAFDESWVPDRVAYLHHPSDPVGYWNWGLLWRSPEWMSEPLGVGVSPDVQWFPVVSFWQVVADLAAGFSTDPGFGHNYATAFVNGWAGVAAPEGWTQTDSERLHAHLESLREESRGG